MALASRVRRSEPKGREYPRLAPPRPLKHRLGLLTDEAECMGMVLMPSQLVVGRYLYAVTADGSWLYPEVADIVARQNGKTELLKPHICARLRMGRRIMHTAQNRELPREVFGHVAEHMESKHYGELARPPRFANGQEEILLRNGGRYRIVSPTRGGARGPANDDVIVDEVRELITHELPAAAGPTLSAAANPQELYLSNMGDEDSVVLNALKSRSVEDPALAYLEWSAAPERAADDRAGWLESNPSVGFLPGKLRNLEREYESHRLAGTLAVWETEYLCRKVPSMRERLVSDTDWQACEDPELPEAASPRMAVAMDPDGRRASAAIAWPLAEEPYIGLRVLYEATGDPIDIPAFAKALREAALTSRVTATAFDPMTDRELAKYPLPKPQKLSGTEFAAASQLFTQLTKARHLRWADAGALSDDLLFTAKKANDETGSFQAVRAEDGRPITAALAAIRAVWLASGPQQVGRPRIG